MPCRASVPRERRGTCPDGNQALVVGTTARGRRIVPAAKTRDLVNGMLQRTAGEPKLLGPLVKDYEYLAGEVAKIL